MKCAQVRLLAVLAFIFISTIEPGFIQASEALTKEDDSENFSAEIAPMTVTAQKKKKIFRMFPSVCPLFRLWRLRMPISEIPLI